MAPACELSGCPRKDGELQPRSGHLPLVGNLSAVVAAGHRPEDSLTCHRLQLMLTYQGPERAKQQTMCYSFCRPGSVMLSPLAEGGSGWLGAVTSQATAANPAVGSSPARCPEACPFFFPSPASCLWLTGFKSSQD